MLMAEPDKVAQPEQVVSPKAGNPSTSTFPGKPVSGGWIPILTKYQFGAPVITDWICPKCNVLTSQSRTCPKCGLAKKETPLNKGLKRSSREHGSDFKLWMDEILNPIDEDEEGNDASRIQRKRGRSHAEQ
jgi:hypothetical protein